MKRILCCLIVAALLMLPASAAAAVWDGGHEIGCAWNRPNCRLLQMAMTGSFDDYDPEDALTGRVYASVYPMLCKVSEEDVAHCAGEFGEDAGQIRACLYRALRSCLWAYILTEKLPSGRMTAAERVLLLFIDPSSQEDAEAQMAQIRSGMTDEVLQSIAREVGAPAAFVRWLVLEAPEAIPTAP